MRGDRDSEGPLTATEKVLTICLERIKKYTKVFSQDDWYHYDTDVCH
jgi:hypothetical protein